MKLRHATNVHKKSRKKSGRIFAKKYKKLNIQEMIIKKQGEPTNLNIAKDQMEQGIIYIDSKYQENFENEKQ